MKHLSIVAGVLFVISSYSCQKPERTIMTKAEKKMLDSIYSKRVGYARKEVDSICDAQYPIVYDAVVDSLREEYIKQIGRIVNGEG